MDDTRPKHPARRAMQDTLADSEDSRSPGARPEPHQQMPDAVVRDALPGRCPRSVVVAALGDLQLPPRSRPNDSIHQPMLTGDAARPPTAQGPPQEFRLADAAARPTFDVVDQTVDAQARSSG